ncbi:hypothetical protein LCGC14_2524290, partial [marine sediment metagenome]
MIDCGLQIADLSSEALAEEDCGLRGAGASMRMGGTDSETGTDRRRGLIAGGGARGAVWVALAVAAVALTVVLAARIARPHGLALEVSTIVETSDQRDLSVDRIAATVRKLAGYGSRVTGYGGDRRAEELIRRQLRQAGITDIQLQPFQVAVPITESAYLTPQAGRSDEVVPLHPLWPNLARTSQTPPDGLTGPLVYVGKGTDAELAGKKIAGSILLIDWDSDRQWLSAGEFGAKAVIFRASDRGTGYAAREKFLTVPANIPRFYVTEADAPAMDALARSNATVTVRCRMDWRQVEARNILALVTPGDPSADPGDPDQTPIIFHAYYDSISVVPSLSPGAEQACGAAVLLELARFLAEMPAAPRRPVYALLTAGHGQSLSGMIHFVSELRRGLGEGWTQAESDSLLARMGPPGLFVGLDLTSRSERMGVFCAGHFRGQNLSRLRSKYSVLGQRL